MFKIFVEDKNNARKKLIDHIVPNYIIKLIFNEEDLVEMKSKGYSLFPCRYNNDKCKKGCKYNHCRMGCQNCEECNGKGCSNGCPDCDDPKCSDLHMNECPHGHLCAHKESCKYSLHWRLARHVRKI